VNDTQINYFLELGKTLNFTKTAQNLYVSQPAVSKQILSLEKEFGVQLFERTNKDVFLTPEGKLFYDFFLETSIRFKKTLKEVNNLRTANKKNLTVGLLEAWDISKHLQNITKSLSTNFPNHSLEFVCYNHFELNNKIVNNEIDIAIGLLDIFKLTNSNKMDITAIPSLLFYSDIHPLAGKSNLSFTDFKDETFFLFKDKANLDTQERILEQCRPYGFVPKIVTVPNVQSMIFNVINGSGVAIFDDWMQYKLNPRLRYIKTGYSHKVVVAWNDTKLNDFVPFLIHHFTLTS
jgi:DNA-binding transcriptional LysR family regulator